MANCYNTAKQRNLDKTSAENPGITDIPSHRHGFAALFLTSPRKMEKHKDHPPPLKTWRFSFFRGDGIIGSWWDCCEFGDFDRACVCLFKCVRLCVCVCVWLCYITMLVSTPFCAPFPWWCRFDRVFSWEKNDPDLYKRPCCHAATFNPPVGGGSASSNND